jgi:hypothetical protein
MAWSTSKVRHPQNVLEKLWADQKQRSSHYDSADEQQEHSRHAPLDAASMAKANGLGDQCSCGPVAQCPNLKLEIRRHGPKLSILLFELIQELPPGHTVYSGLKVPWGLSREYIRPSPWRNTAIPGYGKLHDVMCFLVHDATPRTRFMDATSYNVPPRFSSQVRP